MTIIRGVKKQGFFSRPGCCFSQLLHEETGIPIRFELISCAWSSCCCTNSVNKHRRVFQERRDWMPNSSYLWYLRTYLISHVLNIISINSTLNYVGLQLTIIFIVDFIYFSINLFIIFSSVDGFFS